MVNINFKPQLWKQLWLHQLQPVIDSSSWQNRLLCCSLLSSEYTFLFGFRAQQSYSFSSYHTLLILCISIYTHCLWDFIQSGSVPSNCNTAGIFRHPTLHYQPRTPHFYTHFLLYISMRVSDRHPKPICPKLISWSFFFPSPKTHFYRYLVLMATPYWLHLALYLWLCMIFFWSISNTSGIFPQKTGIFTLLFGILNIPNIQITQYLTKFSLNSKATFSMEPSLTV